MSLTYFSLSFIVRLENLIKVQIRVALAFDFKGYIKSLPCLEEIFQQF